MPRPARIVDSGLVVELLHRDAARPPAGDVELTRRVFNVGMIVKDLDRTLARLRERGVEIAFGPYPASDTQRANVILRDNAGNLIQLFGDRPKPMTLAAIDANGRPGCPGRPFHSLDVRFPQ